jgi:hypothetical protein
MADKVTYPSKEEFLRVFDLFPKGNPESIFLEVKYTISSVVDFRGNRVTWDLISSKYESYIKKRREDGYDDKYIKSLDNFLKAKDYNIDFDNEPSLKTKNTFEKGLDSSISDLENRLNGYKEE